MVAFPDGAVADEITEGPSYMAEKTCLGFIAHDDGRHETAVDALFEVDRRQFPSWATRPPDAVRPPSSTHCGRKTRSRQSTATIRLFDGGSSFNVPFSENAGIGVGLDDTGSLSVVGDIVDRCVAFREAQYDDRAAPTASGSY